MEVRTSTAHDSISSQPLPEHITKCEHCDEYGHSGYRYLATNKVGINCTTCRGVGYHGVETEETLSPVGSPWRLLVYRARELSLLPKHNPNDSIAKGTPVIPHEQSMKRSQRPGSLHNRLAAEREAPRPHSVINRRLSIKMRDPKTIDSDEPETTDEHLRACYQHFAAVDALCSSKLGSEQARVAIASLMRWKGMP